MNPGFWGQFWRQFEGEWIENAFRLDRLVGVGGFGAVFLADHVVEGRLLRHVAVKLVAAEPESMDHQLDELMTATRLHHDHVLRCFHAGSVTLRGSRLIYLVMEAAQGTLESRFKKGPTPVGEFTTIAAQIASALAYLHRQNLVHRDLKPANVLLIEGEWKLSDFGTVRQSFGPGTDYTAAVLGTIAYMPSESFQGTVSPAWDIWSLGALILEALTGRGPYSETTQHELIGAIMQKSPAIPAGLPEPFGEVVRHCLTKDHRERWTAQEVVETLRITSSSRVAGLLYDARRHRQSRNWLEALQSLHEAQQLDGASREVQKLIQETEKQQHDEECERRIEEMRARAVQAAAAGDHASALKIWRDVLEMKPGDEAAGKAVEAVLEQGTAQLKVKIKDALDRNDTARAAELMAELQGIREDGSSRGPRTITEPLIVRGPKGRWRLVVPATIALAAVVVFVVVWKLTHAPRPDRTEQARSPSTIFLAPKVNPKDGLVYVWIPPGTFTMGCSPGDSECSADEKPPHSVTITKGFWIGRTEVTQSAYQRVMGQNPSHWKGPSLPVDTVSWIDADEYCRKAGMGLPTEAEWEYAARGGSPLARYGALDTVAWYGGNSGGQTHEVAQKQPNGFGLYDVLGNVAEWVLDWGPWVDYASSPVQDPQGPPRGTLRVQRGGYWYLGSHVIRVSFRTGEEPENRNYDSGFRCAANSLPLAPAPRRRFNLFKTFP